MLLGIDFGTCNSSAALMLNGTIKLVKEPLKQGYSFPSSVYLTEKGEILVGQAAENSRLRDARRYRRGFKRALGENQPYLVGELSLTVQDLVTEVLKKLKSEAEKTVSGVITDAVITVPASYKQSKRDLMRQAAQAAGFSQVSLLDEPVAAATYYTQQNQNLLKDGDIILVYDFGGGTFDASLIKKQGASYQILSTPIGLDNCGGTNFDRLIYEDIKNRCSAALRQQLEPKEALAARATVSQYCIDIKHQLSEAQEATIHIPLALGQVESYQLHRVNFNQMITPFIDRTIKACEQLIHRAGLEWKNINKVLMVGGSCRIPYVQEALKRKLGHSPLLADEPELAVCQGAAIYGAENLDPEPKPPIPEPKPPIPEPKPPIIDLSDSIEKAIPLAVKMRDKSTIIQQGSPKIYQLPVEEDLKKLVFTKDDKGEKVKYHVAKYHLGKPRRSQEKVLMIIGATREGKSTLINGMANYILGVKYEDDFRFKLIANESTKSQAHSQTKDISAYTLYQMKDFQIPYNLTIIDTPGFGDTEGLSRDKLISDLITDFFNMKNGIDHLDAIGFVTKSSGGLTPTQKYIFNAILSIFGKDIADNIFVMVTFADGNKPPVIQTIKEHNVPYKKFFKFNNSAFFPNDISSIEDSDEHDGNNEFNQMFWKLGYQSFQQFFDYLNKVEPKSLVITKEVLQERKQLENILEGILPKINLTLRKLSAVQEEERIVSQKTAEMNANKNYTYTLEVPDIQKINLPTGTHTTTCLICNFTCHDNCAYSDDTDKHKCMAMTGDINNAVCNICPGKCSWREHKNVPYKIVYSTKIETRTYDDLLKRYNIARNDKNAREKAIQALNDELRELCEELYQMIQQAQKCIRRLDEIALKDNPMTELDYIELLIESEKQEAKIGWQDRVKYLEEAKKLAEILSNLKDATDIDRDKNIKKWAEDLISKLKDGNKSKNKPNSQPPTTEKNENSSTNGRWCPFRQ